MHPLQEERLRHIPFKQIENLGNAIESVPIYLPCLHHSYYLQIMQDSCPSPTFISFPSRMLSHMPMNTHGSVVHALVHLFSLELVLLYTESIF